MNYQLFKRRRGAEKKRNNKGRNRESIVIIKSIMKWMQYFKYYIVNESGRDEYMNFLFIKNK